MDPMLIDPLEVLQTLTMFVYPMVPEHQEDEQTQTDSRSRKAPKDRHGLVAP